MKTPPFSNAESATRSNYGELIDGLLLTSSLEQRTPHLFRKGLESDQLLVEPETLDFPSSPSISSGLSSEFVKPALLNTPLGKFPHLHTADTYTSCNITFSREMQGAGRF